MISSKLHFPYFSKGRYQLLTLESLSPSYSAFSSFFTTCCSQSFFLLKLLEDPANGFFSWSGSKVVPLHREEAYVCKFMIENGCWSSPCATLPGTPIGWRSGSDRRSDPEKVRRIWVPSLAIPVHYVGRGVFLAYAGCSEHKQLLHWNSHTVTEGTITDGAQHAPDIYHSPPIRLSASVRPGSVASEPAKPKGSVAAPPGSGAIAVVAPHGPEVDDTTGQLYLIKPLDRSNYTCLEVFVKILQVTEVNSPLHSVNQDHKINITETIPINRL